MRSKLVALGAPLALALSACVADDSQAPDEPVAAAEAAATPVTSHPRLWIRQADLPRLRSWATSANPMFAQGLKPAVDQAISTYNTQFFPGGQPNPTWPDPGSDQWIAYPTEAYAQIFAFMSLVDPDPTTRAQHAARARALLMHVIDEAVKGVDTSSSPAPFRGRQFANFNRANYWGEAFGLVVDWIYPSLTAADKAKIQKVFLRWSGECRSSGSQPGMPPLPAGVVNDPRLLQDRTALRWAANNFYTGHMRGLTMMSLALDAADDPLVNPSAPATQLGNSMRSYLADVTGAWLYQQYALYEDAAVAGPALGVTAPGLGDASGGLSVEGTLYGHGLGYLQQALLALYTAGYADPTLSGPQAGLVTSAYWDRFVDGSFHTLSPAAKTPTDPSYSFLGPVYQPAAYGDMLRYWVTDEGITTMGSMGILDQLAGKTARLAATRWYLENAQPGGSAKLYQRASSIWGNGCASCAINYFLLFDPAAAKAPDPRPNLPTRFVDKPLGRVLARTDWSTQASLFTYLCGYLTINHQNGACNQIELYRKGEWLTKELTGYDQILTTPDYANTLSIQNDTPSNLNHFEIEASKRGGQWTNGMNAGDAKVTTGGGAGWVYAAADATNLYNRPGYTAATAATDVLHASRAVVWFEPDHVFVYDRATTKTAGRFKRFNLSLLGNPAISGKTADSTTPGGQHLFVQSLLPAAATLTAAPRETAITLPAELEPAKYRLVIQDPAGPADTRFLTVLQGADAGATADKASLVRSTAGTALEGAVAGGRAVLFPVSASAAFAGTTYVVPAGLSKHLVVGLAPSSGYTVTTQSVAAGVQVSIASGGSTTTDAAGVLVVTGGSTSTPPPPPPPPSGSGTCTYSINPASASMPAAGGSTTFALTTQAGCAWLAASQASFIWVSQPTSGTGSATLKVTVPANPGSARTGKLKIGGQTFVVSQAGLP